MTLSVRTTHNDCYAIKFTLSSTEERPTFFSKLPGLVNEVADKSAKPRYKIKTAIWRELPDTTIEVRDNDGDYIETEIEQDFILSVLRALWNAYNGNDSDVEIDINSRVFSVETVVTVVNTIIKAMKDYKPEPKPSVYHIIVEL